MITININNKKIEQIFLNDFQSNKEKFIEFIENSFHNFKGSSSESDNDLSHFSSQIEAGLNSPLSSKSHKDIFKELKAKYA